MHVNQQDYHGACHCGRVTFKVRLSNGLRAVRRCDCSFCRMRGAIAASAAKDALEITGGESELRCYSFNTHTAKHFFCSHCGIYTHHQRRSNPDIYSVNVACLEGVSPFDFASVPVMDGINHPSDSGEKAHQIGMLRYYPAE
jgi:hypothetical protein